MSFEGYVQIICVNGHLYEVDVLARVHDQENCDDCGGKPAWRNIVDQTNDPGDGVIPDAEFVRFQITPETRDASDGHIVEATYHVPTEAETAAMRYDMRYVNGHFEYGRWHTDTAKRLIWTPYSPPSAGAP